MLIKDIKDAQSSAFFEVSDFGKTTTQTPPVYDDFTSSGVQKGLTLHLHFTTTWGPKESLTVKAMLQHSKQEWSNAKKNDVEDGTLVTTSQQAKTMEDLKRSK